MGAGESLLVFILYWDQVNSAYGCRESGVDFIMWGLRILLVLWRSCPFVECGLGHRSSHAPHFQRLDVDFNEIISISKCDSIILQIRSIRWVPILTAQRCSIHLPIQYLTSVHHDHEVFQIHRSFMSHIVLLRQFQVHSKSIGYVCLHWVNELREGVVEVGIDSRIRVMSSKDKVLV